MSGLQPGAESSGLWRTGDRRLQEKERECVRRCERGSRWDPPRRIWMSAGGEGSFRDRKPRRDLGCGKTKKPRTEVKRKRRKKNQHSEGKEASLCNNHCSPHKRVKEHHLQSSRGGEVNYRVSGDAQSARRALSPRSLSRCAEGCLCGCC